MNHFIAGGRTRQRAGVAIGLILSVVGFAGKTHAIDFSRKPYEASSSNGPVEMSSFECRGRKYVYEPSDQYALTATSAGIELSRPDAGRSIRVHNYPVDQALARTADDLVKADASFRAQLPREASEVKLIETIKRPCSAGDWDGFGLTYSYQLHGARCHRMIYVIRLLPEEAMLAQFDETMGKFQEAKADFVDFICRIMVFEDEQSK